MTDDKLIEELDGIEINGPALSDERVSEIIRKKSFNYNEAFYFPRTWLELFKRLAAKDAALSEMRAEHAAARQNFHTMQLAADALRQRSERVESELERAKQESAAQFKRDGEKLTEADRRVEALRKALEEAFEQCAVIAETDMRSPMAKSAGHKPEWHKHGLAIAKRIRNAAARALAPSRLRETRRERPIRT